MAKALPKIMRLFDKAEKELEEFISRSFIARDVARARAEEHKVIAEVHDAAIQKADRIRINIAKIVG